MNRMNTIKSKHQEIEIEYDEKENRWKFELRGRKRSAESLAKAREFIDKPVDEKVEKPFTRRKIWLWKYNDDPVQAEVTSIADSPAYRSGVEVWVQQGRDGRSKEDLRYCFPDDEKTAKVVVEWMELGRRVALLDEKRDKLKESLKPITV